MSGLRAQEARTQAGNSFYVGSTYYQIRCPGLGWSWADGLCAQGHIWIVTFENDSYYVHECICACVCACRRRSEDSPRGCSLNAAHLGLFGFAFVFFIRQCLSLAWSLPDRRGWFFLSLPPDCWDYKCTLPGLAFLRGFWGLNLGPWACKASMLLTGLFSHG